jgi:hypothetical protein
MTRYRAGAAVVAGGLLVAGAVVFGTSGRGPAMPAGFGAGWEVTTGSWEVEGAWAAIRAPEFRAHTTDSDYGNIALTVRFRISDSAEGGHDWGGVHLGVRYAGADDLYYVSVARRDGTVVVKRKAGGVYTTLAIRAHVVAVGQWHRAVVEVLTNPDGAVGLTVEVDDMVLRVKDAAPGALAQPGRVSIRTDEVEADLTDLTIRDS